MELNKIELRKTNKTFNTISSRMMRANYREYNDILGKFLLL